MVRSARRTGRPSWKRPGWIGCSLRQERRTRMRDRRPKEADRSLAGRDPGAGIRVADPTGRAFSGSSARARKKPCTLTVEPESNAPPPSLQSQRVEAGLRTAGEPTAHSDTGSQRGPFQAASYETQL